MHTTYKVLGLLLTYPDEALIESLDELASTLDEEEIIPKKQLNNLLSHLRDEDLLTLQERYVALFDSTASLSLHLFEHIHGESRDRGQAMIDLLSAYHAKGLAIQSKELPDYLPLFLEFLSVLDPGEASALLGEPIDIIALLGKRLRQRESVYHLVFDALECLSSRKANAQRVANSLKISDKDGEELPDGI